MQRAGCGMSSCKKIPLSAADLLKFDTLKTDPRNISGLFLSLSIAVGKRMASLKDCSFTLIRAKHSFTAS